MTPKIQVEIRAGRYVPTPVSDAFMRAVQRIEVHQATLGRSRFQVVLTAERSLDSDYDLLQGLDAPTLPSMRLIISVATSGSSFVIMDGFVLQQSLDPGGPGRVGRIVLSGEDVSAKMDLQAVSMEYPGMSDPMIVAFVLLSYPELGLIPAIVPTTVEDPPNPLERIPLQHSTDYALLLTLANRYGYTFRVTPGPAAGTNYAYWGPVVNVSLGAAQPALTVSGSVGTNVNDIQFSYDALVPTTIGGEILDEDLDVLAPIVTVLVPSDPLASRPPAVVQGLFHRQEYRRFTSGGDVVRGYAYAFGKVLASQQTVARAHGSLDVFRYGQVLRPFGSVGVRGAGESYDGDWYVEEVTHVITSDAYKNQFVLSRGGLGTLTSTVTP